MGAIRKLVLCGDFHCGSPRALVPPSFKTLEGNVIQQSGTFMLVWRNRTPPARRAWRGRGLRGLCH